MVVDLKTGATAPREEELDRHPQLGVYQLAVLLGAFEQLGLTEPGGAELVQVGKAGLTARAKVQRQGALAEDPEPGWAKDLVETVAAGMAGPVFTAPGSTPAAGPARSPPAARSTPRASRSRAEGPQDGTGRRTIGTVQLDWSFGPGHPQAYRSRSPGEDMKAVAVFPGSQQVKIIEQEVPRLSQPDQVMMRMLDVGICGTDKEICSFEYGTPPAGDDHLVIGHESLAEIVQAGSAVERFHTGDLVVPSVRRPCPHRGCLACRSGHQDYCYTGDFRERGIKEAHGYMTEYVVDRERYLNLGAARSAGDRGAGRAADHRGEGARADLLDDAESPALAGSADTPPGARPGAFGAGARYRAGRAAGSDDAGHGRLHHLCLLTRGAPQPADRPGHRHRGDLRLLPDRDVPDLAAQMGNIDLVYEAVGHSHFALQALQVLGTNGIFVLTGVPGLQAFTEADPARLMRDMVLKNQVLLGTVNAGPDAFASALRDLDAFRRRWPEVVTDPHRRALPPGAGTGPDPGQADGHQERDRL